jgi:AcrR family transcriptional regulator
MTDDGRVNEGLRERKKRQTRKHIQSVAFRLFAENGYTNTTTDQIAQTAEIAIGTLFRYFPTKEDLVLYDYTDALAVEALKNQPASSEIYSALSDNIRHLIDNLSPEEITLQETRYRLILSTPDIRSRWIDDMYAHLPNLRTLVAGISGKAENDEAVSIFASAYIGVSVGIFLGFADNSSGSIEVYAHELSIALRSLSTLLTAEEE